MFDNNYSKFFLLPILGLTLCSLLLLLPFNNLQFIIFAAFPLLLIGGGLLAKRKLLIEIKFIDLFWVGFIVFGFLSFFWATNPALVWYRGFCFIGLLFISLIFRDLIKYPLIRKFFPVLMSALFLIIFVQHLMAVHFELSFLDSSWNSFLSRNSNVTTCYLVSLFPFLLFRQSKNQFYRFVKILSAILILNILFLANVKIVILSFLLIMLYYFWSNQRKLLFVLFAMAVFGLIIVNGFFSYDELMAKYFSNIYKPDDFSRLSLVELSKDLILKNPIIGTGQGNWITEVYNTNISDLPSLNNSDNFNRLHSHNIYLKIAGELGLVGLFLFVAPFVITLYRGIKRVAIFDYLDKASFATVVSYLMISAYYGGINLYEYNFSGVEVLAFICVGILSRRLFDKRVAINYFYLLPVVLLTIFWFAYSALSWHSIHTVLHHKKNVNAIDKAKSLEDCYNPVFLNTYGFNSSLDQAIAEHYAEAGDKNKAILHYEKMYKLSPSNCDGLLSYSQFLLREKLDVVKAKKLLKEIVAIQNTHAETNQLLKNLEKLN